MSCVLQLCDRFTCTCHVDFPQGIADGIGISNFPRALLITRLTSSSSGSMKLILRNLLALSSFRFSISHFCFSLPFDASDISFQISGHKETGLEVVCFLVTLLLDHVYPSGGSSINKVNLVKPVDISDNSRSPSTFQKSSIFFSSIHPKMYSEPWSCENFQWKRKWCFSRHVQFDCRFNVMGFLKWSRNHFWLHHHTTMSLGVGLKTTRLILPEDYLVLLLGLGDPGWKWMFSEPDLLQRVSIVLSAMGISTFHHSWASTLPLHCVFSRRFQMRPSASILQCLPLVCHPSKFTPRTDRIQGTILVRLSFQIDGFLTGLSQKEGNTRAMNQMEWSVLWMAVKNVLHRASSHQK